MKNHLDLSKQTAIITGGAGLLGKVYSAALLECGAKKSSQFKKTIRLRY